MSGRDGGKMDQAKIKTPIIVLGPGWLRLEYRLSPGEYTGFPRPGIRYKANPPGGPRGVVGEFPLQVITIS